MKNKLKIKKSKSKKIRLKHVYWLLPLLILASYFGYKLDVGSKQSIDDNISPTPTSGWRQQESIRNMRESIQEMAQHDREGQLATQLCIEKIFNANLETHVQNEKSGVIAGSLTYASEGIPENMTICAFNTMSETQYCTNEHLSGAHYEHGKGYKLAVPAGEYYLYFKLDPSSYAVYGERDKTYSDTVRPFLLGIREGMTYTPERKTEDWFGWISSNYGFMYLLCEGME